MFKSNRVSSVDNVSVCGTIRCHAGVPSYAGCLARYRPAALSFGDLTLDPARGEVLRGGHALGLKRKEYELLLFLARNRGMVLSRDLILERVWGWDFVGGSPTVDVHVRWLREKIEDDPAHPTRIVTVRGMGYRFEG